MPRIDLATLDLNLLVALDRLLATQSVSAAAQELHVSQPAMSRTLARLRDALHDPLFAREGRSLVPTERARALRAPVADALHAATAVFALPEPFDPRTTHGEFRMALGDEAQTAFAGSILATLWREAPGLDVRIRRLTTGSVQEARRGEIELALAPDLTGLPPVAGGVDLSEFVQRRVYDRRFVVVSSVDHPRRKISLAAYAAADHLLVGPEASGRGFVDDYLEAHGLERRVAATITSFHTAAQVVSETKLISTLPEEVVQTSGLDLIVSPPPVALPPLPMLLLWLPRYTNDVRHRFVRTLVERAIHAVYAPKARSRASRPRDRRSPGKGRRSVR